MAVEPRRFRPLPLKNRRPVRRIGTLRMAAPVVVITAEVVTPEERKPQPPRPPAAKPPQAKPLPTREPPKRPAKKIPSGEFAGIVPRLYEGRVGIVFATGPSLTGEVVETIRPYHEDGTVVTFGCNDAYRIVPFLDVHYACDPPWWKYHVEQCDILAHPAVKWTQDPGVPDLYGINRIAGKSGPGLSTLQDLIHFGGNSGFQVLNLALLYGCRKMILCGYNMGIPAGKQAHFFGVHPKPMSRSTSFGSFAASYDSIKGEQRKMIINCTPESALKQFEIRELSEVLEECRQSIASSQASQQ